MIWLISGYMAMAYWCFRAVLRNLMPNDSIGTAVLNTVLALTIGPCLLVPVMIYRWIDERLV